MPFSHHSHSGQFCSHAQDRLEEIVQAAIQRGMVVWGLTEHMPRGQEEDLYPDEIEKGITPAGLATIFKDYYHEAVRLQQKYAGKIHILVGTEVDWIRPSSAQFIEKLLQTYPMDLFIGSVHHVHSIPIDYNREMYIEARDKAGGTDQDLFEDYFDLQLDMLKRLKPPIVGHFDLIRLLSDDKDASFAANEKVWKKILRNLDYIVEYGGLIEINSAALRKGMKEPYPKAEICKEIIGRGGLFTLSDDSHGITQIATHYAQTFDFLAATGITSIAKLERNVDDIPNRESPYPRPMVKHVNVTDLNIQSFS